MKLDIHDFEITSMRVSREGDFALGFIDSEKSAYYEMNFTNVQELCVDGFGLQNIVLDLSFYTGMSKDFGFNRVCGMLGLDIAAAESILESSSLVLIEASSGAEIACIISGRELPDLVRTDSPGVL